VVPVHTFLASGIIFHADAIPGMVVVVVVVVFIDW
jgi:hypothetical protein